MVALGIYIGTVNTLHAESLRGKIVVGRIEGVLLMIIYDCVNQILCLNLIWSEKTTRDYKDCSWISEMTRRE